MQSYMLPSSHGPISKPYFSRLPRWQPQVQLVRRTIAASSQSEPPCIVPSSFLERTTFVLFKLSLPHKIQNLL